MSPLVFRGDDDHRERGGVGLHVLLAYQQEGRMAVPTSHAGHSRIECSRCGTLVAQCRCMGPKPTEYVNGCDACASTPESPDATLRTLIGAYG